MREDRSGSALVVAIAMVMLAGVLLAGTTAAARGAQRAALSREAIARADARLRTDIVWFVASWDSVCAALPVGGELRRMTGKTQVGTNGEFGASTLRLRRLDARHFLLAASTQIGPDDAIRARRRASVLLEFPSVADSTIPPPVPAPVSRWAQHHIY